MVIAIRSSVDDGATRKTLSRSCASAAAIHSARVVGGQVGRDQARSAGRGQVGGEPLDAVALDRVPVGHHERRGAGGGDGLDGGAARRGCGRRRRAPAGRRPGSWGRPSPGRCRAGRSRSRRSRRRPCAQRVDAAGDVGEAGRQVADQGGPALGAGLVERDARRSPGSLGGPLPAHPRPNHSIAVPMSLSPRPERLTSSIVVGALTAAGYVAARRRARARTRWPG